MALQSMTGFARREGTTGRWRWAWELRSVNGKGLDLRLRLPPGFERLETEIRRLAGFDAAGFVVDAQGLRRIECRGAQRGGGA